MLTLAPGRFTSGNPAPVELYGATDETTFTDFGPLDVSPERQPDGGLSADESREVLELALREGSHFFEWASPVDAAVAEKKGRQER